ncbi:hypothetical protein SS05631_a45740 (plasmid) [Sinorhizobium sp. CCBAU 05631]|nr:hypothetical protein SS05631_a45740 [Sinorhizobium sp. CCBAU 05631]
MSRSRQFHKQLSKASDAPMVVVKPAQWVTIDKGDGPL